MTGPHSMTATFKQVVDAEGDAASAGMTLEASIISVVRELRKTGAPTTLRIAVGPSIPPGGYEVTGRILVEDFEDDYEVTGRILVEDFEDE